MIRAGIVGCGGIAAKHISFINQIKNAKLVGIADKNAEILNAASKKYQIKNTYTDVDELIKKESPDVIHILTPPKFHKDIALKAIEHGIPVYIEKPVALDFRETREIYQAANDKGVKVCAGYNHIYDPCMRRADSLIEQGKVGQIVYLESHYGMNVLRRDLQTTDEHNNTHWSYNLPGGLFQNYIDHPLYLIIKYIGKPLDVNVVTSSSGTLPQNLPDELHVMIKGKKAVGFLIISFTEKPQLHSFHIYGRKGCVKVNFDTMTRVFHSGSSPLPKAASKATFNLSEAYQLTASTCKNVVALLSGRLKPYQGMKDLIHDFYVRIENNSESPISKELVLNTGQTIDKILDKTGNLHLDLSVRKSQQKNILKKDKVLVTGASGFLGVHTVRRLIADGYFVRAFVRKLSHIETLEKLGVEIFLGDIRDYDSFDKAVKGMDVIVHLAAETSGNPNFSEQVTVNGTRNLIDLAKKHGTKKVVYMSSMSVYDTVHAKDGEVFTEDSKLEPNPKRRGPYAYSKKEAEDLVLKILNDTQPSWTVLRPAMIFGPGTDMFFGSIGVSVANKFIIVFGKGKDKIRLVNVKDVVEAITLSIEQPNSNGKIYNIVHDEMISKKEYLDKFFCPNVGKRKLIYFPYYLLLLCTMIQEVGFKIIKKKPFLTRYRLMASQREITFSTEAIRKDLLWHPSESIRDQLSLCLNNDSQD